MTPFSLGSRGRNTLWAVLGLLLGGRLLLSAVLPFTDTTEARYGEIARKMLETGNWVTPQYDYGVPFWGKPPLSTWLSASSMKFFDVHEFAARLPALVLVFGILGLVWILGKRRRNPDFALLAVTLTASLPLVFVAAGAVMTDAALAFSTSLSFVAFWLAVNTQPASRFWGYLFFVGQGIGLLAKGPICGILTLGPIFLWLLIRGRSQWRGLWSKLPWLSGTLLMLLIAVPWYVLAERRTPGFFNYFIIGEHFKRFLVSGWHGDKYGHPHQVPVGMIWAYWVAGGLPWSLFALAGLVRRGRQVKELFQDRDGWPFYLLCWLLFPLLFFSTARNVLWTYPLTGLPAFALLCGELWLRGHRQGETTPALLNRPWGWTVFSIPALVAVSASVLLFCAPGLLAKSTQLPLVHEYLKVRPSSSSSLTYVFARRYSAEFYTAGQARHTEDTASLRPLLNNALIDYLAVRESDLTRIPADIRTHFRQMDIFGGMVLLEEKQADALAKQGQGKIVVARGKEAKE